MRAVAERPEAEIQMHIVTHPGIHRTDIVPREDLIRGARDLAYLMLLGGLLRFGASVAGRS